MDVKVGSSMIVDVHELARSIDGIVVLHGKRNVEGANLEWRLPRQQSWKLALNPDVAGSDEENTHNLGVAHQSVQNTRTRKRLLSKSCSNVRQDGSMGRIILVEDALEGRVGGAETVQKVLRENVARVCVRRLLHAQLGQGRKEGIRGQDKEQRRLLDDLQNVGFNGGAGERVQVETDDGDSVDK